jgi:hypothetical protein
MFDFVAGCEPVHSAAESVAPWPHQRRMVRAAWVEKIMSKTTRNTEARDELSEDKLDKVTGGSFALSNAVDAVIKSTAAALDTSGPRQCGWVVRGCRSGGDQPVQSAKTGRSLAQVP